ncbi:MAG: hypothetical protein N839_0011305 [Desulfofustis sp. PB-SRB1]|nr:hypothetical protein [Desulfofustis sp. PB-SRB1]
MDDLQEEGDINHVSACADDSLGAILHGGPGVAPRRRREWSWSVIEWVELNKSVR